MLKSLHLLICELGDLFPKESYHGGELPFAPTNYYSLFTNGYLFALIEIQQLLVE